MLCLLNDVEGAKETTIAEGWRGLQNLNLELSRERENVR
jgi:hypothetical protein